MRPPNNIITTGPTWSCPHLFVILAAVTIGCGESEEPPGDSPASDTTTMDVVTPDTEDTVTSTADTDSEDSASDSWSGGLCGPAMEPWCPSGWVCVYSAPDPCAGRVEVGGCQQLPFVCDDEPDDPVMTCGGGVYRNTCEARADGHYTWLIPADPDVDCGSELPDACADDEFCLKSVSTACDTLVYHGQCTARPGSCPAADPAEQVETCDFELFPSECEARRAGYGGRLEPAPEE